MKNKLTAGLVALLMVFVFLSGCQARPFDNFNPPATANVKEDSSDIVEGKTLKEMGRADLLDNIVLKTKSGEKLPIYIKAKGMFSYYNTGHDVIGGYEEKGGKAPYLMVLQSFETGAAQKSGAVVSFNPPTEDHIIRPVYYYFKDLADYIVYKDSEITVYNFMELGFNKGYNDLLNIMQDSIRFDMNWAKSSIESLKEQLKAKSK